MTQIPIKLIAQLYSVRTTKDGGSKVTFEVGYDSINAILELQKLNATGEINLAIAIIPYDDKQL